MAAGPGGRLTAATSILTLGLGLGALFLGFEWFWMVFVLGWVVVTPLVAVLFGEPDDEWEEYAKEAAGVYETDTGHEPSKEDALETLRDRYARGELSEAQFERKLERLLETETLEDARRHVDADAPLREQARELSEQPTGEGEQERS